jgi:hypothetical protein
MRRTNKTLKALRGWGFDVKRLMETERGGGGVSLSSPKVPRAFSTNVSNESTLPNNKPDMLTEDEWCAYGGLPSPNAYL